MVKTWLTLTLVLGLASGASAALSLVGAPTDPIDVGQTVTLTVHGSEDGAYAAWLQIEDPTVVQFDGTPQLTAAGNPGGISQIVEWPDSWYELSIVSFPPNPTIAAGDHVLVPVIGVGQGLTRLNLFGPDAVTVLGRAEFTVIPEPATIALLGFGGLLLRRRRT